MLDPITQSLYSPFTREVATPVRVQIWNQKGFENFIATHNGFVDCYCDLYPFPFDGTIDKIYFDMDGFRNGMEESLSFAKRFYRFLLDKDLSVIPVASGKKGFNFYIFLRPKKYENAKELLTKVAYSLIIEEFGPVRPHTENVDGKEHPTLINNEGIIYIDPKVIGDIRRFSRIPNTLRPPENRAWCTFLPPEAGFLEMSIKDIYKHIKSPHTYTYDLQSLPSLNDFTISEMIEEQIPIKNNSNGNFKIPPGRANEFLKRIIRPVLYKHIVQPEPRHAVRVAVATDLLEFMSPEEVFEIFLKMSWTDWNPEETRYQIQSCMRLRRTSNRRLRELGIF